MKKTLLTSTFAIMAFLCVSCSSLLDTEQHGVESQDGFYEGDEACEQATTSIYALLVEQDSEFDGDNYTFGLTPKFLDNILSDDIYTGGSNAGDGPFIAAINEYHFDGDNMILENIFKHTYRMIYRSNLVIENFENGTSAIQKRDVAEAKVFRAYSNFTLVTFWKTAPLVLKAKRGNDEFKVPNSTEAQLWEQIEKDLKEAVASNALTEKSSRNDKTATRITKQFAQALLGKAYVFQKKWAEAEDVLSEVVNSNLYGFLEHYSDYFVAAFNNNEEILFSDNLVNDPNKHTNVTNMYLSVCTDFFSPSPAEKFDCAGMSYGLITPSQSLVDAFKTAEPGSKRFKESLKSYDDFTAAGVRLKTGQEVYKNCGYFYWKSRGAASSLITGATQFYWNNNIVMKYSEVLLLYAEALLQQIKNADAYINQVRSHAGLGGLSGATMDDLKREKRLELCLDGCRWRDLVRWGDAPAVLGEQGHYVPSFFGYNADNSFNVVKDRYVNEVYGFKDKHNALPFPQKEHRSNPNLTPNTGW